MNTDICEPVLFHASFPPQLRATALDEAARIGDRIVRVAVHDGIGSTWDVITPDSRQDPPVPIYERASQSFYRGASGIAYFLGELWAATGENAYLDQARKALFFCQNAIESQRMGVALYSGDMGVAFAAARLAELTRDDEWRALTVQALEGLERRVETAKNDMIAGSAGAILGLLRIADGVDLPHLRGLATRLGERLADTAHRSPIGWSWGPAGGGIVRQDLTGYSHGSSGMAHAFLELYGISGQARWRFAASRSLAYESFHELDTSGDWPDFRHKEIVQAVGRNELDILRAQLLAGKTLSPRPPGRNPTWCHGAPGIALSRIRAITLNVDTARMREELIRALRVVRESITAREQESHCLCHGSFGNLETLLVAGERLGISDHGIVGSFVEETLAEFGNRGRPWVTGVIGGGYDPSLLVGEAGTGLFLLRIARPEAASVLCVSDWNQPAATDGLQADSALREQELGHLLPRATRVFRSISAGKDIQTRIATLPAVDMPFDELVPAVRRVIEADASEKGDLLRSALAADLEKLDARAEFVDFSAQFCFELIQPHDSEVDWSTAHVCLAPHARLIKTDWAWSRWTAESAAPPHESETVLIYRSGHAIQEQPLTDLQGLVFDTITEPATVNEIIARVVASVDVEPSVADDLPAYIRDILRWAAADKSVRVLRSASLAPLP